VWSVMRLLQNLNVEDIKIHDTRDADITFSFKGKNYAVEIETGNLLKKKKQMEEKIKYLNKHYPKRWFFVVSNRNFLPKYRKYANATERKGVAKFLEKMLENEHL